MMAAEKKKKKNERRVLRIVIQVLFFVLAPALFTSAFSGIKQFFSTVHQGELLEMNGFFAALITLCVFTMLFGRFFCGYACAFGSLGDFIFFLSEKLQKRTGKRLPKLPEQAAKVLQHVPFVILVLIMLLCALGIYDTLPGWSPWEVFSLVTAGNFHLRGNILGIIIFLFILAGMALESRFFCRFLCPMGAVFRLLPVFPWALLKRDRSQCIKGCSACQKLCPVKHELTANCNAGDCIRCGKCVDVCPRGNISIGTVFQRRISGNELVLTAAKAVLLFAAAAWLGAVRFL